MEAPDFWEAPEKAQEIVGGLKGLKAVVGPWEELSSAAEDLSELFELASEEEDEGSLEEIRAELRSLLAKLDKLELRAMMSDPHDGSGCYLSVHAGAGGTDACDWAAMLLRMYGRWIEEQGFKAEVIDEQPGEEAGLRSVTARVRGDHAYGYLRNEVGVHRLVRHSPFDQAHRRHTAFASVDVVPEIKEAAIEIDEKDLRVDTYRAGGAGGQHVNKTDSAVRITHIPSGIVVQCQNERSQHKNRREAMALLSARLYREREKEREAEIARQYGEKGDIAWGNQIRSYVLQPYTLVKDHRTSVETGNTQAVLDGAIDPFLEAFMRLRLRQGQARAAADRKAKAEDS
jgi:peptide chain release factor 2